jgi:hypothetical protein
VEKSGTVQDTHGFGVIEADLVDVWRMEGEHLEYNEAEGENVRLYGHLLVLYHLEI